MRFPFINIYTIKATYGLPHGVSGAGCRSLPKTNCKKSWYSMASFLLTFGENESINTKPKRNKQKNPPKTDLPIKIRYAKYKFLRIKKISMESGEIRRCGRNVITRDGQGGGRRTEIGRGGDVAGVGQVITPDKGAGCRRDRGGGRRRRSCWERCSELWA